MRLEPKPSKPADLRALYNVEGQRTSLAALTTAQVEYLENVLAQNQFKRQLPSRAPVVGDGPRGL